MQTNSSNTTTRHLIPTEHSWLLFTSVHTRYKNHGAALTPTQRDTSMLTFEAQPFMGTANILDKLQNLPFQKVQHRVDTKDAQPLNQQGGILVLVTGALMVRGGSCPVSVSGKLTGPRSMTSHSL
jgi:hypothetical protein